MLSIQSPTASSIAVSPGLMKMWIGGRLDR